MRDKVKLDDQQIEQLNHILDETRSAFDDVRTKMRTEGQAIQNLQVERITAILRDDQKPLYTALRANRERLRRDLRKKQRK